jgi:PTH1 family peptidyl-tRNA hydrolase
VVLLKPQTFMNLSGNAVQAALQFYKIPLNQLYVFHDELDLVPAKVRIKCGGGAGGHNGLKSIDAACGQDYWRVRIGIGHPGVHEPDKAEQVSNYVLSDFAKADRIWLDGLLGRMADHLPLLVTRGGSDYLNALSLDNTKE